MVPIIRTRTSVADPDPTIDLYSKLSTICAWMIYGTGNRSCLIYLGFKREASWTVGRLARFLGRALCCTGQLCSLLPTNEKIEHQKIEMVLYVYIKLAYALRSLPLIQTISCFDVLKSSSDIVPVLFRKLKFAHFWFWSSLRNYL